MWPSSSQNDRQNPSMSAWTFFRTKPKQKHFFLALRRNEKIMKKSTRALDFSPLHPRARSKTYYFLYRTCKESKIFKIFLKDHIHLRSWRRRRPRTSSNSSHAISTSSALTSQVKNLPIRCSRYNLHIRQKRLPDISARVCL